MTQRPPARTRFGYLVAVCLLALCPGPDNLMVMTVSIRDGLSVGVLFILGLMTGVVVHIVLAAVGFGQIITAHPRLYRGVLLLGAGYLFWLSWCAWSQPVQVLSDTAQLTPQLSPGMVYIKGCGMSLLNPKLILFFLAFFPSFVPQDCRHPMGYFLLLGAGFICCSGLIFTLLACLCLPIQSLLIIHPALWQWVGPLSAGVIALLGIYALSLACRASVPSSHSPH